MSIEIRVTAGKDMHMSSLSEIKTLEIMAHQARNLDTTCYRGFAPLSHLALISQADVFDQDTNPEGLQRELSIKHAQDAYEYALTERDPKRPRAFPEVVINARQRNVVKITPVPCDVGGLKLVKLRFYRDRMKSPKTVYVSRVDGNHRLHFAAGDERREPLNAMVPFQLHVGLSREEERSLFLDINSNQKGMNISHLSVMQSKLSPEEREIRDHPDRWMAQRLTDDPDSPWHGLVHLGGSKKGARAQGLSRPVNFASLQSGVARTLAKSQYIHDLTNPRAQYVLIRHYWTAVKRVFAEEWANPKDYLLLKNIGVLSLSILGGTIIDRCMPRGKVEIDDLGDYLRQTRNAIDWSKVATGDRSVAGMSGNRAALIIAGVMASEISDDASDSGMVRLQELLASEID